MTRSVDEPEDEVFFKVGAVLRARDEQLANQAEGLARGDDPSEFVDRLTSINEEEAEQLVEMQKLAAPLSDDFLNTLGDVAVREVRGAGAPEERSTSNVISLATWRTRSWKVGGGVAAIAASLVLLFTAGDEEEAWNASYELQLLNAPETVRGVEGKPAGDTATKLSIGSSGLVEWVLRPEQSLETAPAFAAYFVDSGRDIRVPIARPCMGYEISPSGAIHVELTVEECSWLVPGGSYDLQFVIGLKEAVARHGDGVQGDGVSSLQVKLEVLDN